MCILAFLTHYSPRFPFVLVNNRDELRSRLTHPVGVDAATGLLWAADGEAGGSWLGVNVRSGRFAVVTNCVRAPTAPLRKDVGSAPPGWRGAMPLAEVVRRMNVHADPLEDGGGTNVSLEFVPDRSRGCIVRDFLTDGRVPGEDHDHNSSAKDGADISPSLVPPYFDGYNLLTADSLFNAQQLQLQYTTNRYGVEYRSPTENGVVHCLQNSHLDNWVEPKSALLRDRFQEAIGNVIPTDAEPYDADFVATSLASSCLCLEPGFDLRHEIQVGKLSAEVLSQYQEVLDASLPYQGYNGEAELTQLYGAGQRPPVHFPTDVYKEYANRSQRDIFVANKIFGTRTQTVVVVESLPDGKGTLVHFSQRECDADRTYKKWCRFSLPSPSKV